MNLKEYLKNLEELDPRLFQKLPSWVKELKVIAEEAEQEEKKEIESYHKNASENLLEANSKNAEATALRDSGRLAEAKEGVDAK